MGVVYNLTSLPLLPVHVPHIHLHFPLSLFLTPPPGSPVPPPPPAPGASASPSSPFFPSSFFSSPSFPFFTYLRSCRLTPRIGARAGDSPRVEAGLAEQLELVLELLLPVVPPLRPSVERHTRKNKIFFYF